MKCWDVLPLMLDRVANKRLAEGDTNGIEKCFYFGCSNSCMLSGTKCSGSL
jgi:hypothetical protein